MSITEWPQEQEPSQVRLAKALSWHYPNREYLNSLLVEKQRQDLEYAISHLQLQNLHLDGLDDNEKYENLRTRLNHLNSLTTAKSKTKTNTGLNQIAFRVSQTLFFVCLVIHCSLKINHIFQITF